jgi:hypothetical protein
LAELVRPLKDLGVAGNVHSWQPRNGRGTFALTTLKKGTRLELFVPDPSAATAAREVLAKTSTQGTYGTMPPLREALSESFRRFHGQAVQAVPDVIASPEWVASRVTGTFTDEVLQDLVSFGRLPDEFSLLNWKSPEGVTWDLLLTASGWKLTIFWPQGKAP